MRVIINFFKQISALSCYKLAIESIQAQQDQIFVRIRVRFSGFTYESTPAELNEEIVKFPPLHAFIIGYLYMLAKHSKQIDSTKLEPMKAFLNQEEYLTKFKNFLNCKMMHQTQKIEIKAGEFKNEIGILDLKTHPELISSISPKNAYQLGLAYGDLHGQIK